MFRRLKNLWQLSRFEITKFDNQLVITEKNGELICAKPEKPLDKAIILKRENPAEEIIGEPREQ